MQGALAYFRIGVTLGDSAKRHGRNEKYMEGCNLINVLCRIRSEYRLAVKGDLCCIRELHGDQAEIDIIESSGFRRCTLPLECIEIQKNPRTIKTVCSGILLCMNRYLIAEGIDRHREEVQFMKQFLRTWSEMAD